MNRGKCVTRLAGLEELPCETNGLLARREEIKQMRRAAAAAVNTSLDNRRVRMPGYLLPLEFSGTEVIEFLLVPTVGACIHVPPPPPNQMVHVKFADGFEAQSLYTPVWVEGTMAVGNLKANLFLKDGSADIAFGYRINAIDVKNYNDRASVARYSRRQRCRPPNAAPLRRILQCVPVEEDTLTNNRNNEFLCEPPSQGC